MNKKLIKTHFGKLAKGQTVPIAGSQAAQSIFMFGAEEYIGLSDRYSLIWVPRRTDYREVDLFDNRADYPNIPAPGEGWRKDGKDSPWVAVNASLILQVTPTKRLPATFTQFLMDVGGARCRLFKLANGDLWRGNLVHVDMIAADLSDATAYHWYAESVDEALVVTESQHDGHVVAVIMPISAQKNLAGYYTCACQIPAPALPDMPVEPTEPEAPEEIVSPAAVESVPEAPDAAWSLIDLSEFLKLSPDHRVRLGADEIFIVDGNGDVGFDITVDGDDRPAVHWDDVHDVLRWLNQFNVKPVSAVEA